MTRRQGPRRRSLQRGVPDNAISVELIRSLLKRQRDAYAQCHLNVRVRRMLINRDISLIQSNLTGTVLPPPFNKTSLGIKSMEAAPMRAAQHYATRIASNVPDISVIRTTSRDAVSATVDREAGKQERVDAALWEEMGGRQKQWEMGWTMSVGSVGYYVIQPRDAGFGLPDRLHYTDRTDDEIAELKRLGVTSPVVETDANSGKLIYAERADVWAARRDNASRERAVAGTSLFTLEVFPWDQVLCERDIDGIKWAAIVSEIPADMCAPGSDLAYAAAAKDGVPMDDRGLYGLFRDPNGGKIIGGISRGQPVGYPQNSGTFTLIRFYTRSEYVILIGGQYSVDGAREIYRGRHGCRDGGAPACPVVEVPFMRTDVNVPGNEFATALSQVFAYVPLLNQLMTLRSNATAYNLLPRWVVEQKDGTILRDEDGEPVIVENAQVPGLNPNEATAYPGTLRQLTIETSDSDELLKIYIEQLALAMPAAVTSGAAGASAAAWQVRQLIQQSQEVLRQPVDNHSSAVRTILRMCHSWLRELDERIYFYTAPGHRSRRDDMHGLIEFNPADFTDSIKVVQELDTAEEATVREQEGLELLKAGVVTYEVFFEDYAKRQDSRQAVIDMYVQQVINHVMGGIPAAPGSIIQIVADSVRGMITYQLLQSSPNFAIASAEAQMSQMQAGAPNAGGGGVPPGAEESMPGGQAGAPQGPPGSQGNVAYATGTAQPGMGMNASLNGQLGANPGLGSTGPVGG